MNTNGMIWLGLALLTFVLMCESSGCADDPGARACGTPRTGNAHLMVEAFCDEHAIYCEVDNSVCHLGATGNLMLHWCPSYCSEDLDRCEFVLWHELAHIDGIEDQTGADCYAARNASSTATDAALCSMAPERAAEVRACR